VSVNFPYALFSLLDFLTLKLGPTGFPEMSVQNYHSTLHNISLERTPHVIWYASLGLAPHVTVQSRQFGASYANLRQPHIFKHQI